MATAGSANAACNEVVNIGVTVKDGNYAKGSGSFTACNSIREVWLTIYSNGNAQKTEYRYPSAGTSLAFSVVENCGSYRPWGNWYTIIQAFDADGALRYQKMSNTTRIQC